MPPEATNKAPAGAASQDSAPSGVPEAPAQFTPAAGSGQSFMSSDATAPGGWSWGGAMFNVWFAAGISSPLHLLWILVLWVPFLNFIVLIGLFVGYGLKGRSMAASSKVFASKEEYIGFMKGVDKIGKLAFMVALALVVLGILASIVLAALGAAVVDSGMPMGY